MLATVGVVCLVASITLTFAKASVDTPTVVSSTAHFSLNKTYLLSPASGAGAIKCKVVKIDGSWLNCEGNGDVWVNINTIMNASDR